MKTLFKILFLIALVIFGYCIAKFNWDDHLISIVKGWFN